MEIEVENENKALKDNVHMGHNVMKFRILKGLKQSAFGSMIGMNQQQAVSRLESQREIKVEMLEKIAPILGVSVDVLRTMPEETGSVIFENNTFESGSGMGLGYYNSVYNDSTDKVISFLKEFLEEERKEKQELRNKIDGLEKLIMHRGQSIG